MFYVKANGTTNVIEDVITFPYQDYVPVEVAEVPQDVMGGWFKLENGVIVEYPELKPVSDEEKITALEKQLEQTNADLQGFMDFYFSQP